MPKYRENGRIINILSTILNAQKEKSRTVNTVLNFLSECLDSVNYGVSDIEPSASDCSLNSRI